MVISNGANACIGTFLVGLLNEGDELLVIEPYFPLYQQHMSLTKATIKTAPLEVVNGEWKLNFEKFEAAFSPKTRMFLFNNPHNPTGKCFT